MALITPKMHSHRPLAGDRESQRKMEGKAGNREGRKGKGENPPRMKFLVMALVAVYIAGLWS